MLGKRIEFELANKAWVCKKSPFVSFPNRLLKNAWIEYMFLNALSIWESVRLGPHIHMKGGGLVGALVGGVWFVKIGRVINGWFVVCMGDEVEDRSMVAHDEVNGWWKLQGSITCDELGDVGHLVPMR